MFNATNSSAAQRANLNQAFGNEARLNRIHRLFKTHYNVTEPSLILDPYLFLGNCISAQDIHRLSRLGIRYILNVAIRDVEICPYYPKDMRTLSIDLRDDDRENILRTFDQAFAFIDEARRTNSRILVHCSHGQSRSPAIVIGYLMRTYNVSLEQCLAHVVKARACVIPNDGFLKQLILYDRFLVERRRQQQEAAVTEVVETAPPTEIPIQHHSSNVSPSAQKLAPVVLNPPKYSNYSTANNVTMTSSSSSSIELQSTSSGDTSTGYDSIQVIPIQVESKEPSPEKTEVIEYERVSIENDKTMGHRKPSTTYSEENVAEIHQPQISHSDQSANSSSHHISGLKRRSSKKKTSNDQHHSTHMRRSKTGDFDYSHIRHQDHSSINLTPEQWEFINSIPPSHSGVHENSKANYITEIYDRATKRFIPTTCCY